MSKGPVPLMVAEICCMESAQVSGAASRLIRGASLSKGTLMVSVLLQPLAARVAVA